MTSPDPILPGAHGEIVTPARRATTWFYQWLQKMELLWKRVSEQSEATAAAVAALPEPAPPVVVVQGFGIDVGYEEVGNQYVVSVEPGVLAGFGMMGPPGMDGADGYDGWPGPPGPAGPTGATGASGTGGSGQAFILREEADETAWDRNPDAPEIELLRRGVQGDIAYRGATGWALLAAGTTGKYLKTQGAGADPAWDTPSGGGGGMTLVTTVTVSGSPATSMTASGLDLDTDKNYVLQVAIKNQVAAAMNLRLFFNSDTTTTNYDSYVNVFSGGGLSPAGGSNTARFIDCAASDVTTGFVDICKDFNARPLGIFRGSGGDTGALRMMYFAAKWRTAGTNVTGITLSSNTASSLAVGSFFKVWKLP